MTPKSQDAICWIINGGVAYIALTRSMLSLAQIKARSVTNANRIIEAQQRTQGNGWQVCKVKIN